MWAKYAVTWQANKQNEGANALQSEPLKEIRKDSALQSPKSCQLGDAC